MKNEDTTSAVPPLNTTQAPKEQPLVELRFKPWVFVFVIIVIISCIWFSILGAIIPYLTTGDFNEIWPAHSGKPFDKSILFVFSWVCLLCSPALIGGFRVGVISFYETHVELRPYLWFFKKLTIPYDAMHVTDNSRGMTLTYGSIPKWQENQYNYWKALYMESINISAISMGLSNPEGVPQAFQIIRDRAFKINKS